MSNAPCILFSVFCFLSVICIQSCSDDGQPADSVETTDLAEEAEHATQQAAFFENLSTLCGETFEGEASYPDDESHPLVGTTLRTHISECDDSMIRIELYRDTDYWHGAWVIERRDEGLHLFHDHLGDVRTEEDLGDDDAHGYGGYAGEEGSATVQYFPADEVTAEMLPEASTNVWMMEMDLEADRFIYYLERHDEPRFRAELSRF